MIVYDAKGQPVEMPEDKAWAALSDGSANLAAGQEVTMRNPTGGVVKVTAEQAAEAMKQGYAPASEQEWAEAERRAKYETIGGQAMAAVAGAGRGATLGATDALAAALGGPEAAEALRSYQQLFPMTSMGGELVGAVAPAFLTGGSSSAASAAELAATGAREASTLARGASGLGRVLTAPARLQQGLGGLAERGVADMIGGGLGRGIQTVAPELARGIVEGGIQGIGNSITEQALGDHNLTAEEVIANIGHGALLGGALGGGVGLARYGAGELTTGVKNLLTGRRGAPAMELAGTGQIVPDVMRSESSAIAKTESAANASLRNVDELNATGGGGTVTADLDLGALSRFTNGTGDDAARILRSQEDRAIALRSADKEADDLAFVSKHHYDRGKKAFDEVENQVMRGEAKDAQMAARVDESRFDLAAKSASDVRAQTYELLQAMRSDPAIEMLAPGLVNRVEKIADAYNMKIAQAAASSEGKVGKLFATIDDFKHEIGSLASRTRGKAGGMLQSFYEVPMRALEDESVWSNASKSQAIVNPRYHKIIGLKREAAGLVEYKTGHQDKFDAIMEADPAAFKTAYKQIGGAESYKAMQILNDTAVAQKELADAIEQAYTLTPHQKTLVERMKQSTDGFHQSVKAATDNMSKIRTIAELEAKGQNPLADALKAVPGVGPVLSIALATNPVTIARRTESFMELGNRVKTLLGLKSAAESSRAVVDDVARKIISPSAADETVRKTPRSRGEGFSATSAAVKLFGSSSAERRERYTKARDSILQAANNPERSKSAAAGIAPYAPSVAAAIQKALTTQAKYLAAQLPPERPVSTLQPGLQTKSTASDADIETFARRMQAIESPATVLQNIARGTASMESVEALREGSPALFASVQQRIRAQIEQMTAEGKELPYPARVKVSVLFGVPADQSLRPEFIQTIQTSYGVAKQQQAAQQAAMKAPAGSGSKMRTDRFTSAANDIEGGELGE